MAEYIDRILLGERTITVNSVSLVRYDDIMAMPAADVVPVSAYQQAIWERDTALSQLKEIGKGFCEKMDDVAPVRHGKWVLKTFDDGYGKYQLYECNLCGAVTAQRKSKNYCPHCGAKMEAEDG